MFPERSGRTLLRKDTAPRGPPAAGQREDIMMQYSVFTDADWLFPDSAHSGEKAIELLAPRASRRVQTRMVPVLEGFSKMPWIMAFSIRGCSMILMTWHCPALSSSCHCRGMYVPA